MRLALLTLVAGAALAVPATPSSAAECTGVAVVVDFASLGGGERTGCAQGDPESGVTALRGAGFEPTRAAQEAGYFVCRIDGKPANDPCQRASPADAYWSYWHAKPGGSWTFSNQGAADYDPKPGEVEGWAFGAGNPPSKPPPAPPKREQPTRAPAASPAAAPAQPAPSRAAAVAATSAAPRPSVQPRPTPTGATPTAKPTATSAISASPTTSASPSASPDSDVPLVLDDPPAADGSGPWVGVLLAVAVVAGLGAAAARQAQRRR